MNDSVLDVPNLDFTLGDNDSYTMTAWVKDYSLGDPNNHKADIIFSQSNNRGISNGINDSKVSSNHDGGWGDGFKGETDLSTYDSGSLDNGSSGDQNNSNTKTTISYQTGTYLPSSLSDTFNYIDFTDTSDLTFVRSASVKNKKIDLNGTNGNTTGAVWTKKKYLVSEGFRVTYKFQIGALTGSGSDGIWFHIQNSSGDAISTGGYSNSPQGGTSFNGDRFTVGIDSYNNPSWDPNNWHVEWSYKGFGTEEYNLKSTPLPDSKNSNVHTLTIEYDAANKRIFVLYDDVLVLEDSFDLKNKISLDSGKAYIGCVGICGGPAESHEILSWKFEQKVDFDDNDNDGLPDDTDGDGLPDYWETHYGVTDTEADEDNDGLLNRQEYILKTNPTLADTDGDELLDSEENGTGTWVNINNTGTNPLVTDTDGDGLLDGVETNGTIYISKTNTGTDPHKKDTDGDALSDFYEIEAGSNPLDDKNFSFAAPYAYYDFENLIDNNWINDESGNNGAAKLNNVSITNEGTPNISTSTKSALFPGSGGQFIDVKKVKSSDTDLNLNQDIKNYGDGSYTMSAWLKPNFNGFDTGPIFSDSGAIFLNGFWAYELGSNHNVGSTFVIREDLRNNEEWMHVAWIFDGSKNTIKIYRNGELRGETGRQAFNGVGSKFLIGGFDPGRVTGYKGLIDDVGIWRKPLADEEVKALFNGINPVAISSNSSTTDWKNGTDSDSDSLPDAWEMQVFGDLDETAEADTDNDRLTNSKELDLGTDPNDSDTDNDGLSDAVETNTGTWVSNSDRGTDPKKADTDADGFSDAVETNTGRFVSSQDLGTSPLKYSEDPTGWVHLAWVYDGVNDKIKMYVDGKLDAEKNQWSQPKGNGYIVIGGNPWFDQNRDRYNSYNGLLDDVAIWDTNLSDDQIKKMADGLIPRNANGYNIYSGANLANAKIGSRVIAVAAGDNHSVILDNGGLVTAWGSNTKGQSDVPSNLTQVQSIAAGLNHTAALKRDGTVVVWGDNSLGQSDIPTNLTNVTQIASGNNHIIALKSDGTVIGWGSNSDGQLDIPNNLSNVKSISAGNNHSIAVKNDGSVVGWGSNKNSEITIPSDLGAVKEIFSSSGSSPLSGNFAVLEDGSLRYWGAASSIMKPPTFLNNPLSIAAGPLHGVAINSDGSISAWGSSSLGKLIVPNITSKAVMVAAGGSHSLAVLEDGSVRFCWVRSRIARRHKCSVIGFN